MKINFARLNHVFIPTTKEGRDRLRRTPIGRALQPFLFFYEALTPEGGAVALFAWLSVIFSLDVLMTDAHLVWAGLSALVLVSLVLSRLYPARDLRLAVALPRRVTVGEEIVFTVILKNEGPRDLVGLRVLGPFLPWDGTWTGARGAVAVLPQAGEARVVLRARFRERGEHHLDPFRAHLLVPLGLAHGPAVYSEGSKFLVVPRPARVVRMRLPMGQRHQPGGMLLASKTGDAMEICGVRPYRVGDPVRDLHARSWARVGFPVVREYQQEYFSRVGVVVDTDLGGADPELLEDALSLAAGVVRHLSGGEALIDLLVVGETVHTLTLGRSLGTFEQALDHLACVRPGPDFSSDRLLMRLLPHLPRLSCLIVIALRWDAARTGLVARVRSQGTGCRTLLLQQGEGDGAAREVDMQGISCASVRGQAPLAL